MNAIKIAEAVMNSIIAERKVLEAITKNISPAADRSYWLGEECLVYFGKKNGWVFLWLFLQKKG